MSEIGRTPLLTSSQEIQLSRQIQDLLAIVAKREALSNDEQVAAAMNISLSQLQHRIYQGRKAKNQMVQANLRLVVSMAKHYLNRGVPFQDLVQEGTLGLIRAAEKFDPQLGNKFSTYASWWIKQSLSRAIHQQSRTVRLPSHIWDKVTKIKKTTKQLSLCLGRKPTEDEIATATNLSIDLLRTALNSWQLTDSLDRQVGVDEDTALVDLIAADGESIDERLKGDFLRADLEVVLKSLTPFEAQIIRLRYGLNDGNPKTVKEIAPILNWTTERIRKTEAIALRKLRHRARISQLRDYIV